jgi:hypothetical protein
MRKPRVGPFRVDKDDRGKRVLPAGVTEWDLRSGRYRRLFKGVYVGRSVTLTPLLLAQAALLLVDPLSVVSHQSAARIWGGVVPDDGLAHVSCAKRRPQVHGLAAHRVSRGGQEYATVRGVKLTTPAQTFLDLAADLGLVDLVVLGDSLVKTKRVTPAHLVEAAAAFRGRSRRMARRAAGLVRAEVDSPMETRLRLLLVLAGLPEPVINHKIRWPGGTVRFRFDLSYPEYRLIIEYDGRQHAESDDQWGTDLDRREWMDGGKWRLIVVRSKGIYSTPALTLQRVIGAMRDQGMPVPTLSDEWRQYFASRPDDVAEPA